jgi:hypothetical protein
MMQFFQALVIFTESQILQCGLDANDLTIAKRSTVAKSTTLAEAQRVIWVGV